ncbi:methyl-accepting chemotaxis protein [Halopseudomonas pelagia]|uniref:methyl-accepting chemotaxis protein n=1 Tax=Halopseudomonas pelagia TaxID=553151 RepID=UPI0030DB70DC|tara:strand:- start:1709 stop:2680 length:972 start_codon:yes stop_codon:yes gene_type:complete
MLGYFRNMGFRWKLTLPLGMLAIVFLALGMVSFVAVTDLSSRLNRFSSELLPQATTLLEADRDLYQALVAERAFVHGLDPDEFAEMGAEHRTNMQQAIDRVNVFAGSTQSAEGKAMARQFNEAFAAWKRMTEEVVTLAQSDYDADVQRAEMLSFGQSAELFGRARDIIDQMTQQIDAQAALEVVEAREATVKDSAIVTTMTLIGLAVCMLMILLFPGLILRPIQNILGRIRDIADGEGDLTKRVDVQSTDEVGQLGQSINQFLGQLQTLIREVADSTLQVAAASEQMSTIAAHQDRLVNDQYSAIDQVSTAATEMTARHSRGG